MAGNIKGITIEFRGDTTKLDSALRKINTETRGLDKELRNIDKALKFNPTSVELWRQKQELLTQKIDQTKEKLRLLKDAQAKMDADGVDKNTEEYRKLQREIIETESKVKTFESQLKKIGNINLKATSEQIREMGTKLTDAGEAMRGLSIAGAAVAGSIGTLAYKSGVMADDLNTLSKVTGIGTDKLQMYGAAADLVDVSVEAIAKSNTRLKKAMLSAEQGSKTQAAAFESLGVSITNSDGSLRDSDAVFQDVLSSLGSMTNETERDAIAMQLMGKSASELNPLIEDGGETYKRVAETMQQYGLDFVDQETLDKANQFNDQLDTMKVLGTTSLNIVGARLAEVLAPALEKVVTWMGLLAEKISTMNPKVLTVIGVIGGIIAVVAPLLIVLGKVAFGISSIISLAGTLGISLGALAGPVGIVLAVIAALIAIGVLLYKNWDTIKAKLKALQLHMISVWNGIKVKVTALVNGLKIAISNAWNTIKTSVQNAVNTVKTAVSNAWDSVKSKTTSTWNSIKNAIIEKITAAKDKVKGIVEKIKGFFPISIGKIMSNLKLPHFKLSGEFSLEKKTVPKLSIEWYKTGGIFESPSVIGVGEAGAEAVVPLDKFWKKLDNMQGGNNININVYGAEGQSAKEIAEEVRKMLIKETKQRRLAWQ